MSTETRAYKTAITEYEGKPMLTIYECKDVEVKKLISFGTTKAKAFIANIDDIKKFVEENDKK